VKVDGKDCAREMVVFEPVLLSTDMAAALLLAPLFLDSLPEIARVSQSPLPVFREGNLELLDAGYDAGTRTLVEGDLVLEEMPVNDALEILKQRWLGEFPFTRDDAERGYSTVLAGMLAPFCELLVPPFAQRPAFIFTANREGGGKTLLARLCLCPVHGKVRITPSPEKGNDAELKKLLGSLARAGDSYILFDNWKGKIESPSLEAFVTSNIWSDRLLGASEIFNAQKSCLVYVTGNGAKVSPDMRRRSMFVDLFVEEVRTETRHIHRRIDEEDIIEGRAEILSCLWSIVRHWDKQGRPKGSVDHGTFGKWGHVVGGMVEAAGLASPLTQAVANYDEGLQGMEQLIAAVLAERPSAEMKIAELTELARDIDLFGLGDEPIPGDRAKVGRRLERFFDPRQPAIIGDVRLSVNNPSNRSRKIYSFERLPAPPAGVTE
jgi:hypothetical protein